MIKLIMTFGSLIGPYSSIPFVPLSDFYRICILLVGFSIYTIILFVTRLYSLLWYSPFDVKYLYAMHQINCISNLLEPLYRVGFSV